MDAEIEMEAAVVGSICCTTQTSFDAPAASDADAYRQVVVKVWVLGWGRTNPTTKHCHNPRARTESPTGNILAFPLSPSASNNFLAFNPDAAAALTI